MILRECLHRTPRPLPEVCPKRNHVEGDWRLCTQPHAKVWKENWPTDSGSRCGIQPERSGDSADEDVARWYMDFLDTGSLICLGARTFIV